MKWLLRSAFCTALDPVVHLLDTTDPNREQNFVFEEVVREPAWAEDANGKVEGMRVLYSTTFQKELPQAQLLRQS